MSVTNATTTIELDRLRTVRMDMNALAKFEEVRGKDFVAMSVGSASDMRALLWACLLHEDPTLTIEQVGSWISLANVAYIKERLDKLADQAAPTARPSVESEAQPASVGPVNGSASKLSPASTSDSIRMSSGS